MLLFVMFSQMAINLFNDCQCSVQNNAYEITAFYEIATTETGAKSLTNQGNIEEVNLLLKPIRFDEGTYEIEITWKTPNLYQILPCQQNSKIAPTKYYLETRYCHEFANYSKAILKVEGNFGVVRGKVCFK